MTAGTKLKGRRKGERRRDVPASNRKFVAGSKAREISVGRCKCKKT